MSRAPLSACIVVLNYNGMPHLQDCLSTALRAARRYRGRCAVVCVDNRSPDGSGAWTRSAFPDVEVITASKNDFLFSLNAVLAGRREDVAIVVNNDMRFDLDFVWPLLEHFDDPAVFAVGAAIRDWEGARDTVGPRCARATRGWFHKWWSLDRQEAAYTLEACGGAAAYRRRMFTELGGFDDLYRPGYYEDLDLSYRAWARGWKVVYEPRSRAFHKESVSMVERYGDAGKARLLYRNHLLFTVKNIGDSRFLASFLLRLPYRILRPLLSGYTVPLAGFVQALPRVPAAFRGRWRSVQRAVDLGRFATVTPLDDESAGQAVASGE